MIENFSKICKDKTLIVGLGNITNEYQNTRHNAGFMFVEYLQKKLNLPDFEEKNNLFSLLSKQTTPSKLILLAKPITFMNDSGKAVKHLQNYFRLDTSQITIVHDDLDIEFAKYKIQRKKGPHIHNGLLSIENHLNSNDFLRIRIGVETRDQELREKFKGRDFVLSKFTKEEIDILENQIFESIYNDIKEII